MWLHEALAPYREWVAGHEGEDPSDPDPLAVVADGGHCQPVARMPLHALSADLECAHGRVPIEGCEHDCHAPQPLYRPDYLRPAPEPVPTPDLIGEMATHKTQDTIAKVISDLEAEIARLAEAKARLEKI